MPNKGENRVEIDMSKAIVLHETGGPEQLRFESVEVKAPAANEVALQHVAIGVNYIDTYMRSGLYPVPMPAIIGQQAVGIVTALGNGAKRFSIGDRVAYGSAPIGAYAEQRVVPEATLVAMPDDVSDEVSAANLLRGMTAEYLLHRLYALESGDTILVHAAAGATGIILTQWARALGARVIGAVGAPSRFDLASEAGAELVLEYNDAEFLSKVRDFTDGALCDVVYDSVGKDTFDISLACVKVRGMLAAYGNGSGKPEPLDVLRLAGQGSVFLTRPRLDHYTASVAETESCAARFFDALASGAVKPRATRSFSLAEAALAHHHLEDRVQLTTPVLLVD